MESNGNVAQYNTKFKELFERFLDPQCEIKNDVYFNRLLSHLSNKEKEEMQDTLINQPVFSEWLIQAVLLWEQSNIIPTQNVASFALNLASLLSRNETKFCQLNTNNFYIKLVNLLRARQPDVAPSIKLGYIKLQSAFLEHKPGIEWMVSSNFWEDILNMSLTNQTVYITKEGHKFISKLLEATVETNLEFCNSVVKKIMDPLGENILIVTPHNNLEVSDEMVQKFITPTLQLIGNVLEFVLESSLFACKDFNIVLIFLKNFHLEQRICNLLMIAQNRYLIFDLGKIMFIMQFLELYVNVVTNSLTMSTVEASVRKIMSLFSTNISKGNFENVMKFCYFGQFYWNLMGYKIPCKSVNKENEPISFANQLIVLQMIPVSCIAMLHCKNQAPLYNLNGDPLRDEFLNRIFSILCENTIRIGYSWRDYLMVQTNLFEIASKALVYIMQSRKYYPRQRAALVFQCFIYTLKDIMETIKEEPEKFEVFARETQYMSLLLEGTAVFIEEFQITWRDSVETICVMAVSFDFLSIPTWPTTLVVKALKLVNISIAKYMSPNLALLIDRTTDSTMALMGPLLYAKLHDGEWEVRDSALEVVCTIARLSNSKFPSLRKVLMDSDLPNLVVKMSKDDGESFVRATALKCLQEMIKVDDIWNNALQTQDLPQKMRGILINETEGIVRVEAATLICVIYEHHNLHPEKLGDVYDTMLNAVTSDLHWEVKVRTLNFWEQVITNCLQNQGMIDGRFPDVTFSKENRKIVTLTHLEIKKRLQKVLGQLSEIGCLAILMTAIKDDCDLEVAKTAVKITKNFVELLRVHNLTQGDLSTPSSPIQTDFCNFSTTSSCSMSVSSGFCNSPFLDDTVPPSIGDCNSHNNCNNNHNNNSSNSNSEEIIEQIINSRDVCLLNSVYSPSDYGSCKNYDYQVRKVVSPNEFLQFTRQDLDNVIKEKKNWLSGIEDLGSLLDDMLKSYNNNDDINNMDCY